MAQTPMIELASGLANNNNRNCVFLMLISSTDQPFHGIKHVSFKKTKVASQKIKLGAQFQ